MSGFILYICIHSVITLQRAARESSLSFGQSVAFSSQRNTIPLTSVRVHSLLVVEEATVTGKHQNSSSHVAIVAATASRVANLGGKLGLVGLIGLASGHFRWEDTRCDGVDADLAVLEGGGQHAAEVGARCLRRSVGELTVA
jgi:hypothetical protein